MKMEFTMEMKQFKSALETIKPAVPGMTTLPVLQSVQMEAKGNKLTLRGTNLEVGVEVTLDAQVDADGSATVNHKNLVAFLPKGKGKSYVAVERCEDTVYFARENRTISLPMAEDANDFPPFPELEIEESINLKDALKKCLPFASREETRHFLNGVCIHGGPRTSVVATDGRALKWIRLEHSIGECELIIPNVACNILKTKLPDKVWGIGYNESQVLFQRDDVRVFSRRIEGTYPDYEAVAKPAKSKDGVSVTVDRVELLDELKEVTSIFKKTKGYKSPVIMQGNNGQLALTAKTGEGDAQVEMSASVSAAISDKMKMQVDARLFIPCLQTIDEDEVTIWTDEEGLSPLYIESGENEDTICMPMRL
jgi:DNA polymerase-3 subunit beta